MGRSFKENPWKYKNNKDFQKKFKKKHQKHQKHQPFPIEEADIPNSPFDDPPEYHESFGN